MLRMIASKFIDWAKSLFDYIHLNKNTNTTEIDNNLKVGDALIIGTNGIKKAAATQTEIPTDAPIVEDMTGYSIGRVPQTKGTLTYSYASICKNGNKLTLVVAFIFNKKAGAVDAMTTANFMMPSDVVANIVPAISTTIDVRSTIAFHSYNDAPKTIVSAFIKHDASTLYAQIVDISGLGEGVDYYIRQEITILLTPSLLTGN